MSERIIISRPDSIGDVVLTLPLAGIIKQYYPTSEIWFIGRKYTEPIISVSEHIDHFIDWDVDRVASEEMDVLYDINANIIIHAFPNKSVCRAAKRAGIPRRIATSRRLHTLFTCNERLNFSRKNSDLHEAVLNTKLLQPIDINEKFSEADIVKNYGFTQIPEVTENLQSIFDKHFNSSGKNIILHPLSAGSAVEWGLKNFSKLTQILSKSEVKVFLTGTEEEGEKFRSAFSFDDRLIDLSGLLSLNELIVLIEKADALIANSTGPLHIASALGKKALGLYSSRRPIHPGRWKPLGINADYLVYDPNCKECMKKAVCKCIENIEPETIVEKLMA